MGVKLTKQQQQAKVEYGHNIIVSAGAGSGKTAVLSQRVYEFIANHHFSINEFLILTFTNLAAGEMKQRIRKILQKNHNQEANYIDNADISTFDSFALNIVKKYHFLLKLSPNIKNIDSNIMMVEKSKIVDQILEENYVKKDQDFIEMISCLCLGEKDDIDIKNLILKIHEKAELALSKEEFFHNFIDKYYSDQKIDQMGDELEQYVHQYLKEIEGLLSLFPAVEIKGKNSSMTYLEAKHQEFKEILEAKTYDEIMVAIYNKPRSKALKSDGVSDEEKNTIDQINKNIKNKLEKIKGFPKSKADLKLQILRYQPYLAVIIKLVEELDVRQMAYKMKAQAFEFNDIAKMALDLVKNNEEIRLSLKNKYRMIMIDEYQDTSALQEEFVSLISNDNVYMVGDIKQSIYAFRNARSDIFKDKYEKYKNHLGGEALDMNTNFRSRQEVLADINEIFRRIMTLKQGGADYEKDHLIEFGNMSYEMHKAPNQDYHLETFFYDPQEVLNASLSKEEMEIRLVAQDIIKKIDEHYQIYDRDSDTLRDVKFSDFCILMDRGTTFNLFSQIFNEYHIPLYIIQDEDIKDKTIIKVLKNLLILVKGFKNNCYLDQIEYDEKGSRIYSNDEKKFLVAYLSIGRSFLVQEDDYPLTHALQIKEYLKMPFMVKIKELVDKYHQDTIYSLLNKILNAFDIYHQLVLVGDVKNNGMYLEAFLNSFAQMSELDFSLDDFIAYLEYIEKDGKIKFNISSQGSSINSVQIMNIHKSKGLEFPIIYYCGLSKAFNLSDTKASKDNKYTFSEEYGFCFGKEDDKTEFVPSFLFKNKYLNDEISERTRLFYVALTRAKEKMILIAKKYDPTEESSDKIDCFYDFIKPYFKIFKSTFFDVQSLNKKTYQDDSSLEKKQFTIREVNYPSLEEESVEHASKKLKLGTSKKSLEFGTTLHEILEIVSFQNPDLSFIKNEKIRNIITNFLSCPLLEHVKEGQVYKEFEFSDATHHGIIDLMIVYFDHIDIIDYKTKNILDESYDEQVKFYKDYIATLSNKEIHLYIYSLLEGKYRQVA